MTEIIKIADLKQKELNQAIKQGKIIIYPTDTVYGMGCDATNRKAIEKIRQIKNSIKPFSIIALSKPWIKKNLNSNQTYINKLPGPFTFILTMKNKIVSNRITNDNTIGIRIPDHELTKMFQKTKTPILTTSANQSGKPPITNPKKIPRKIKKQVDLIIDAGILENKPSTIIDLTTKIPKIIRK